MHVWKAALRTAYGCAWCLAIALIFAARPAASHAQVEGFQLARWAPGHSATDSLTGPLPTVQPPWKPTLQLWSGYTRGALQGVDVDNRSVSIVRDQVQLALSGSIGITRRFRALLSLPLTLVQTGDPTRFTPPSSLGLGDLGLGVSWMLLGDAERGPQLGVSGELYLPTGSEQALSSDGSVTGRIEAQVAYQTRRMRAFAGLGGRYRPERTYGDLSTGPELSVRGGVIAHASDRVSVLVESHLATTLNDAFAPGQNAVEVLAGARLLLLDALTITFGLGAGLTEAPGTPTTRALLAIGWGGVSAPTVTNPPQPVAPVVSEDLADRDQDGTPDARDACPDAPEDMDQHADDDGCPDADNDNDGIADEEDQCPAEPETFNSIRDDDGCADWEPTGVQVGAVTTVPPIAMDTGASIPRAMLPALEQIAVLLRDNPRITKVFVEGHAHGERSDERALRRSARAAQTVRQWLIRQGITAQRLDAVGLGDDPGTSSRDELPKVWVGFHVSAIDETGDAR